jgi:hypothetical protein
MECLMTIVSFGEYPEIPDENAVRMATERWSDKAPSYSNRQRNIIITKLAVGIIVSWGVLASAVVLAFKGGGEASTLGIVLSSVFACTVPLLTCALVNLARNLDKYKPYKYDLDNPETVQKIRTLLLEGPIAAVSCNLEDYCDHLEGAGVLTADHSRGLKGYIDRQVKLSSDRGWFYIAHSKEEILSNPSLLERNSGFEDQKTQLKVEWEAYQENHLLNALPSPAIPATEKTSLTHIVINNHDCGGIV